MGSVMMKPILHPVCMTAVTVVSMSIQMNVLIVHALAGLLHHLAILDNMKAGQI
jgi:hypothetical protein